MLYFVNNSTCLWHSFNVFGLCCQPLALTFKTLGDKYMYISLSALLIINNNVLLLVT